MGELFKFAGPFTIAEIAEEAKRAGVKSIELCDDFIKMEFWPEAAAERHVPEDDEVPAVSFADLELSKKRDKYEVIFGRVLSDGELAGLP